MNRALDLLRARLAPTPLARLGFSLEEHPAALGLAHHGVDTGLRADLRLVAVPRLAALAADGRWVEVSVPPALLDAGANPVVLVVVDADGHAVWATRAELLDRLPPAARHDPAAESWQVRFSALDGLGGFGLHRLFLVLAAGALRPVLDDPTLPGSVRTRTLLRRFVEEGDGFDVAREELLALGVPGWFVAAHATAPDAATLTLATPPYVERVSVELRGARESLTLRGCPLRCVRGGTARSTWVHDAGPSPVGLTLRLDHVRTTLELRAALVGAASSATALAAAARLVWRFGQGGRVTLLPGCAAAGVPVGSVFPPLAAEAVAHGVVETLDALATIERATGAAFVVDPASLGDPAQAEAIRELLLVWSSARGERLATAMRLSLTAAEVHSLLDAAGLQRRITFRLPPSRVSQTVLGASVALGQRVQEITGTLVQSPGALARFVATLDPAERLDVELSAVEVREFYASAPPAATTTAPQSPRDAPSGSRSGST